MSQERLTYHLLEKPKPRCAVGLHVLLYHPLCVQAITRAETQSKAAVAAANQELQQTKDQLAAVQERLQKVSTPKHSSCVCVCVCVCVCMVPPDRGKASVAVAALAFAAC